MKKIVMAVLFIFALSSVAFASPLTDFSKGKAALDINYRVSPDYDLDARVNDFNVNAAAKEIGLPTKFDGDSNLEWGFTYGIGNNWALQYRQATPKGKLTLVDYKYKNNDGDDGEVLTLKAAQSNNIIQDILEDSPFDAAKLSLTSKTRVEEYNVMYKLDKNFSLFTGIVKASPSLKANASAKLYWDDASYSGDVSIQGHDKNIWQFGVVAVKPLNKDFTTYGIASVGSDYRNLEVGLGYKVAKDLEFNVNYRDLKVDDMKFANFTTPEKSYNLTTDAEIKGWGFGVTYNF